MFLKIFQWKVMEQLKKHMCLKLFVSAMVSPVFQIPDTHKHNTHTHTHTHTVVSGFLKLHEDRLFKVTEIPLGQTETAGH